MSYAPRFGHRYTRIHCMAFLSLYILGDQVYAQSNTVEQRQMQTTFRVSLHTN
jgi:23S rRNA-/tRNA-specific pseudouridylate synthase